MYGNPSSFFPATFLLRNKQENTAIPRRTTRKTTSLANDACWIDVRKALGQLDTLLLLPPPPPPRRGAILFEYVFDELLCRCLQPRLREARSREA